MSVGLVGLLAVRWLTGNISAADHFYRLKELELWDSTPGGGGGGTPHVKRSWMLVVPLRGQNLGFWYHFRVLNIRE